VIPLKHVRDKAAAAREAKESPPEPARRPADVPPIPDDAFRRLGKRQRRIARDAWYLLLLATTPTIEERDRMGERAEAVLKRFKDDVRGQRLSPHGPEADPFRMPGLAQTLRELNWAVMNPACILVADRNPRFMRLAADIHDLIRLMGWISGNST
jgi:hypothetical protein